MALTDLLDNSSSFPDQKSNRDIIWWWEKKRILYNAALLVFGSLTLLLGYFAGAYEKSFPWIGLIFFAVSANIFYTAGCVIDMAGRKYLSDQPFSLRLSPVLFLAGTVFSVCLTFVIDLGIIIGWINDQHP